LEERGYPAGSTGRFLGWRLQREQLDLLSDLRRMGGWTLWKGWPLLKRKKRLHTEYELEMWEHQPLWVVLLPPFGKEKG
jgi:hypothetical protein